MIKKLIYRRKKNTHTIIFFYIINIKLWKIQLISIKFSNFFFQFYFFLSFIYPPPTKKSLFLTFVLIWKVKNITFFSENTPLPTQPSVIDWIKTDPVFKCFIYLMIQFNIFLEGSLLNYHKAIQILKKNLSRILLMIQTHLNVQTKQEA